MEYAGSAAAAAGGGSAAGGNCRGMPTFSPNPSVFRLPVLCVLALGIDDSRRWGRLLGNAGPAEEVSTSSTKRLWLPCAAGAPAAAAPAEAEAAPAEVAPALAAAALPELEPEANCLLSLVDGFVVDVHGES